MEGNSGGLCQSFNIIVPVQSDVEAEDPFFIQNSEEKTMVVLYPVLLFVEMHDKSVVC